MSRKEPGKGLTRAAARGRDSLDAMRVFPMMRTCLGLIMILALAPVMVGEAPAVEPGEVADATREVVVSGEIVGFVFCGNCGQRSK